MTSCFTRQETGIPKQFIDQKADEFRQQVQIFDIVVALFYSPTASNAVATVPDCVVCITLLDIFRADWRIFRLRCVQIWLQDEARKARERMIRQNVQPIQTNAQPFTAAAPFDAAAILGSRAPAVPSTRLDFDQFPRG